MKKTLLSLGLAVASLGTFAQSATNAEIAGNEVVTQGYLYNYGRKTANADLNWETLNALSLQNTYTVAGVTVSGDATTQNDADADGAGSLLFTYAGTQGKFAWTSNLFTTGNGSNLYGTYFDFTTGTKKIRSVVQATKDCKISMCLLFVNSSDAGELSASDNVGLVELKANTWTEVEFDIEANNGTMATDFNKPYGWSIRVVVDDQDNQPAYDGVVAVDWVEVGDALNTKSFVTSLEEQAEAVNFTAFPNPSTDVVNFNADVNGTIELVNALGSVVTVTNDKSIDVSELPSGIYFATLKVNGVAKAVQRVQVK